MDEVVPSEELRAVVRRVHVAMGERDLDAIGEIFSAEPYLLILGTDPEEIVEAQGDVCMIAFPSAAFALRASLTMHERIAVG